MFLIKVAQIRKAFDFFLSEFSSDLAANLELFVNGGINSGVVTSEIDGG